MIHLLIPLLLAQVPIDTTRVEVMPGWTLRELITHSTNRAGGVPEGHIGLSVDVLLTEMQPNAKPGDVFDIAFSVAADNDGQATPFAALQLGIVYDPDVLHAVSMTTCGSPLTPFLFSAPMQGLLFECPNEGEGEFPDPDGDLLLVWVAQLGTSEYAYAAPTMLFTLRFEVVGLGDATVALTQPESEPPPGCNQFPNDQWYTKLLDLGNVDVTGDISDTATVSVRSAADVDGDGTVGIVDLLLLLAAWGT